MLMTNEIIELLPSQGLKSKIRETGYRFSEKELLYIIYGYAPSFEKRIEMLERFAKNATPEGTKYALWVCETERKNFGEFCKSSPDVVYELHIKETPHSCDEKYLCDSYETALSVIDMHFAEYESAKETEDTRYTIEKKQVFSRKAGQDFTDDILMDCELCAGKVIKEVNNWSNRCPADCDGECGECEVAYPPSYTSILFPRFIYDRDIVRYTKYNGEVACGIHLKSESDDETSDYCVVSFDSDMIYYHDYDMDFLDHTHIDAPFIEKISEDEITEKQRADYRAFMEYLDNRRS